MAAPRMQATAPPKAAVLPEKLTALDTRWMTEREVRLAGSKYEGQWSDPEHTWSAGGRMGEPFQHDPTPPGIVEGLGGGRKGKHRG